MKREPRCSVFISRFSELSSVIIMEVCGYYGDPDVLKVVVLKEVMSDINFGLKLMKSN